jgi:hypothetical protein
MTWRGEVIEEMVQAFGAAWHAADGASGTALPAGTRRRAGIDAVLKIVDRERPPSKSMAEVMRESAGEVEG